MPIVPSVVDVAVSHPPPGPLHVLGEPSDTLAVALSHHDRAHKHLDRTDALQRHLALARGLVHAQLVAQFVLGHSVGVVDLVAQDDEGHLG
jgi:hypothetical protein